MLASGIVTHVLRANRHPCVPGAFLSTYVPCDRDVWPYRLRAAPPTIATYAIRSGERDP